MNKKPLRCVAVDDEPIALDIIRRYCERRGGIELEIFTAPREAMKRISEWPADIVLMDIEMNGTLGTVLARRLPPSCCLIFITAFSQYAIDGFEAGAVDFLQKPFFYERFERAIERAATRLLTAEMLRHADARSPRLMLKSGYKTVAVPTQTIVYVESIDNYVEVHQIDGTVVRSKTTLQSVERNLPPDAFVRIHRSYIVAVGCIVGFTRTSVTLRRLDKTLPIGKNYADAVCSLLNPN
ncbi:MAG: LytR/AlgR family response regulator transcription factor [Alloprevotella sp.]